MARAQQPPVTREVEKVHTSQLKMKNPENFDGKTTTILNQ